MTQLVLAGLAQQGWCGVPSVLPALPSSSLLSPGTATPCKASSRQEGWCQQELRDYTGQLSALNRNWLPHLELLN